MDTESIAEPELRRRLWSLVSALSTREEQEAVLAAIKVVLARMWRKVGE